MNSLNSIKNMRYCGKMIQYDGGAFVWKSEIAEDVEGYSQFKKRTYDTCVEKIYICVDICVCAYIHIFCINSYCICFVIRSIRNMESTCSVDRDDERIYNKMQYGGIYVSALFNCIVCTCNVRKYNFGVLNFV